MAVLEETNVEKRLTLALELIKKELQMSKMQREISKKVEDKIKKAHHEHMLREQLKVIKKELGMEKDDKDAVIQKFRDAIENKTIPEHAAKVIDAEIKRLEFLEPQSSEFQGTDFRTSKFVSKVRLKPVKKSPEITSIG